MYFNASDRSFRSFEVHTALQSRWAQTPLGCDPEAALNSSPPGQLSKTIFEFSLHETRSYLQFSSFHDWPLIPKLGGLKTITPRYLIVDKSLFVWYLEARSIPMPQRRAKYFEQIEKVQYDVEIEIKLFPKLYTLSIILPCTKNRTSCEILMLVISQRFIWSNWLRHAGLIGIAIGYL